MKITCDQLPFYAPTGKRLRVLVACEFSGTVREAFRRLGHDAWSCDLLPAEDGGGQHYQVDILYLLAHPEIYGLWDLIIAHPPCTYLTVSGVLWCTHIPEVPKEGTLYGPERIKAIDSSVDFVMALANAPAPRIAIENPIGLLSTRWREPDQVIQPWYFGHPEFKATCLWLKNLPLLVATNKLNPPEPDTPEHKEWSKVHYALPGPDRWKIRSRTYQGIANAMAKQWGGNA